MGAAVAGLGCVRKAPVPLAVAAALAGMMPRVCGVGLCPLASLAISALLVLEANRNHCGVWLSFSSVRPSLSGLAWLGGPHTLRLLERTQRHTPLAVQVRG